MRLQTKTAAVSVSRGLPMGAAPRFVISTDHLDSENDRILQAGLSFRDRMRVLFAHDSRALPVGVITAVHRFPSRTEATFAWIENDSDAARVRNLFEQNGLDASVGLRVEDAVPNDRGGYDIRKATVHEVSLTPTPANFHAIALTKALSHGREDDDEVRYRILLDEDEPMRYRIDPAEVRRAVRQHVGQLVDERVRAAVRRETRDRFGRTPPPPVLRVEDESGAVHDIDADLLRDAIGAALSRSVGEKVRMAVNALTGRID